MLNPLTFVVADWLLARPASAAPPVEGAAPAAPEASREPVPPTQKSDHVVLVGYGRVGRFIGARLSETGTPYLVVEENSDITGPLREQGVEAITGNGADPDVVAALNLPGAKCVLVAIPDAFEGGQVVAQARAVSQQLPIIARAHSEEEIEHLKRHGASSVIMGEHEIAKAMVQGVAAMPASGGTA
jgi:CPA2 family monovalent cation:H+ antiporter-2